MKTEAPLQARLLKFDDSLTAFLDYVNEAKLELYEAQEEAILSLFGGANVILKTPTGSGKSLVATALHFDSLRKGRISVYTSPIKALVNEKFFALCKLFGAENVGLSTGDASVNLQAPILCCTAEVLAQRALADGDECNIQDAILDEFHYYSDQERGIAWQIPLITLKQTRFLLLSATMGETEFFEKEITRLNGRETLTVFSNHRPVPLDLKYSEEPLTHTIESLVLSNKAPIYLVHYTQKECVDSAGQFMSTNFTTKEEKFALKEAMRGTDFSSPFGKELSRYLHHGIAIHHAGLLPKYRLLVESLAQKSMLKLICGTDTLGVGVNIPIRTVVLTRLYKFDGQKARILPVRDFKQVIGRAGRKGFDDQGYVVAQAPEHTIENLQIEKKIRENPAKGKKLVKAKPPEKNYVNYTEETFKKLLESEPEPLTSRFGISAGLVLSILMRKKGALKALSHLIRNSHEPKAKKKKLIQDAVTILKALKSRALILSKPAGSGGEWGFALSELLQHDFSLHEPLSLYFMDAVNILKQPGTASISFENDVVSLAEAICENPESILRSMTFHARNIKYRELKSEGVEYDEIQARLEEVSYEKPLEPFLNQTLPVFLDLHPWVKGTWIQPKKIALEIIENFLTFDDFVETYGIERQEGLLLRYLSQVYKVLRQTLPSELKTPLLEEYESYLYYVIKTTDSSLVDEWSRMAEDNGITVVKANHDNDHFKLEQERKQKERDFDRFLRNQVFQAVVALAQQNESRFEKAVAVPLTKDVQAAITKGLTEYLTTHKGIVTQSSARALHFYKAVRAEQGMTLTQTLTDPESENDWELVLNISDYGQMLDDFITGRRSQVPLEFVALRPIE